MFLSPSLYTVLSNERKNDAESVWKLQLHPEHEIFQAHFPNQPILPGACMLQMAKELLEQWLRQEVRIDTLKNMKFLQTIDPRKVPCLELSMNLHDAATEQRVRLSFSDEQRTLCKMELCVSPKTTSHAPRS